MNLDQSISTSIDIFKTWKDNPLQTRVYLDLVEFTKEVFKNNGKIIFCGNGGSSAEAAHFAGEFIGKCSTSSLPLPALAISESSVQFSAITNDFGFEQTFTRSLKAFATKRDLVVLLSTSGTSANILTALEWCRSNYIPVSLWTSEKCDSERVTSDFTVIAPTKSTPRAQELHLLLGHLLAEEIEISYAE